MDYRFKHTLKVIKFPKGFEEEQRGLKGCCDCKQLVLAHPSETETWKNDVKGVVVKKSDIADVVSFTMEDSNGNVVSNEGKDAVFPNDSLAIGYIYNWRKVLNEHGAGCYKIKVNFTISGTTGGYTEGVFELKQYSVSTAKETVRIRSKFNSKFQRLNIDFTDSNFEDSVRFNGTFGKRQPKTDINNLIGKSRKVEKTTRENLNQYTLESDPLPICITRQLIDLHFLNEDECFMSDHSPTNHDYLLFDKPVSIPETPQLNDIEGSRLSYVVATFGDRTLNDKSYYNKQ